MMQVDYNYAMLESVAHHSKSLFSDHFLTHRFPEMDVWHIDLSAERAAVIDLLTANQDMLPTYSEAQLEQAFIQPLLDLLGYAYQVQTAVKRSGTTHFPDYTTFADDKTKTDADASIKTNPAAFYGRALNIIEAKYWERPLSRSQRDSRNDVYSNADPSFQIVNYLTGTRVTWGVLTNGRTWRLYNRDVSNTATEFYEVDLVDAVADAEAFKRFWLFFRKEAFLSDGQGKPFVQRVLTGSEQYARAVGDHLKQLVFTDVFPLLAGGFTADVTARGETADSHQIYEATLSLLYKLLFLLYAEARTLLPVDHSDYRDYSLSKMVDEVENGVQRGRKWSHQSSQYYSRLLTLFRFIDTGDETLNLPRYNGGLFNFDTADHPNQFLQNVTVSDHLLADALDKLTRMDGERIDYRYIGVRHLGAVYEGLLEFTLVIEDAANGTVTLLNDKGERKATGSYYTPDYIVNYIVEETLRPIIADRRAQFSDLMDEIGRKRADGDDPAVDQLAETARKTLLDIKLCDPAMGSGHFLVEAVDYLTDELIVILAEYPDDNPILDGLALIRERILATMAEQGIVVNEMWLNDTQLLQRVVMKRCIYGVDLNRMAVELAKVSLWLHSFTVGAPLSFLDHHLRCGNSLVGTMAREAAAELTAHQSNGQAMLGMFNSAFQGLLEAATLMRGVSQLSDATFDEVAESSRLFQAFDTAATPYKQLLDVATARHFGVKRAQELLDVHGVEMIGIDETQLTAPYQEALIQTRELYNEHRFFHWDLEFPELFIDLEQNDWDENGGFDAVISNPPYVRQETLRATKPFFQTQYKAFHRAADLYVYFMELATNIAQDDGRVGVIVSHKFMRSEYGLALRQLLTRQTSLQQIIHFSDLPVFPEASAYPAILMWQKQMPTTPFFDLFVAQFNEMGFEDDLPTAIAEVGYRVSQIGVQDSGWTLRNGKITQLQAKIAAVSTPLVEYVDGRIHYGIKTGLNDAFFVTQAVRDRIVRADGQCVSLFKPLAVGEDLRRYGIENQDRFLLLIPAGWTKEQSELSDEISAWAWLQEMYAPIADYLAPFSEKAKKRQDMGDFWWELRPCAYYDAFESSKIIYPVIAKSLRFSLDQSGYYGNDKTFIIPFDDPYLLALLNSELTRFFGRYALSGLQGNYLEFRAAHFQHLPIYTIQSTTPEVEWIRLTQTAIEQYKTGNINAVRRWVDNEIEHQRDDTIYDLLVHLAMKMGLLYEQLAVIRDNFWLDVEGAVDDGVFADFSKGKWEKSLAKAGVSADFVDPDSRRSQTLDDSLAWDEDSFKIFVRLLTKPLTSLSRLVKLYRTHAPHYRTLHQQMIMTNQFINQIIYKLYRLSDEEIIIVENG